MKKIISSLFVTLLLAPTLSLAVGLGSVRNYSFLNERLNAEIPILSIQPNTGINVSLASNEEFAKRGITREAVLNDLQLSTVEKNGRSYIKIGSVNRITVPYLNFVLQLTTNEGNILREYAIFLDPRASVNQAPAVNQGNRSKPITKKAAQPAVRQKPAVSQKPQQIKRQAPKQVTKPRTVQKPQASAQRAPQATNAQGIKGWIYGPVREGETIWRIALNTRPSKVIPIDTFIQVLKQINPKAFKNGQLRTGSKLLIPKVKGFPDKKKN